ncbi:transposase [Patescibacteria group bacterium]|nr:transposase [Patescibacteria group bacterium]
MFQHRNSQKRYYSSNYIYFVTFCTKNGFPYFHERIFCDIFMDNLKLCKQLKQFELYAFCLLPNHAHILFKPGLNFDLSNIMHFIKKNVSYNVNKIMEYNLFELTPEGGFAQTRLRFDNKLKFYKKEFENKYGTDQNSIPKFKWQESFHDHIIRDIHDFDNHLFYTAYNFHKHKLPDNWQYSSINYGFIIDKLN